MFSKLSLVLKREESRFIIVGIINTGISYLSFLILDLFVEYLVAYTLSYIIGIINSFLWNKFFTFKSKGSVVKEAPKFVSVYLISYVLGVGFLYLLVDVLGLAVFIAVAINLLFTTLISWFGHKYFSFRKG